MNKSSVKNIYRILASAATAGCLHANPADLKVTKYADSSVTPSPACLAAHANGDVYVGVDLSGSLGKGPNKGRIIKLVDTDNDGTADTHTTYAKIDNPRGLIPMGNKLYVLHSDFAEQKEMVGMYLSVLEDKDNDGKADGPPKHLIKDISTIKFNRSRGADHTTNGIRMGIDGWIYIAVGDFGFVDALGTDGTKMTFLGGGILRVRPDGSEMEPYTYGLRNIYDIAIDPFMNVFTRGNTNDGIGWWIRFMDQIQTGDYGYPSLYMYFADEIIPALCDLGSGSGTGALFMDEPTWPSKYNKLPMMVDWGRNHIYLHRLTPDGPTFTQKVEDFIGSSQPSDIDVDGSGRLYVSAWDGASYKGSSKKGYVERITPKGWEYKPFPDLSKLKPDALIKGLKSSSATARICTQQELFSRGLKGHSPAVLAIAEDKNNSLEVRVAALFTFAQMTGKNGIGSLIKLTRDSDLTEFALRALTDRESIAKDVPLEPFLKGLNSNNDRVKVAALVGLGRIGKTEAAEQVIKLAVTEPRKFETPVQGKLLFETGNISVKGSAQVSVKLDSQSKSLYLVSNASGSNAGDHVAWFDPQITAHGKTLELNKWKKSQQSWGKTILNKSCTGAPLKRKDGKPFSFGIGTHTDSTIHFEIPAEYAGGTFSATVAFADTANNQAKAKFTVSQTPLNKFNRTKGPHATPNSKIVIPHIAVQTLRKLKGVDAALGAIESPAQDGAIWALRRMHDSAGVDGLIAKLQSTENEELKIKLMDALARLYSKEAPYDGSWWWNTKPDPHGPYYVPKTWSESDKIATAYLSEMKKSTAEKKALYTAIAKNNKAFIAGINDLPKGDSPKVKKVGEVSIENVMLAFEKLKPNKANGKNILKTQACFACHSIEAEHSKKGPDLNKIGSTLNTEAIAEAVLKPEATIADVWVKATTHDGAIHSGTLVEKGDTEVIIRDIAGIETKLKTSDVKTIKKADSTIMAPHLLDSLTLQEFVDVISYLASKK